MLEQSGLDSFFPSHFQQCELQGFSPARVIFQGRDIYRIVCRDGERWAVTSGRMRHAIYMATERPVCGDWVAVSSDRPGDRAIIHDTLPRRTRISRKVPGKRTTEQVLAANVDTVFLVSGLDADFNPRRIERYLVLAKEGGVEPVIVLNKADLCADLHGAMEQVSAIAPGAPVFCVCALDPSSLAPLAAFLGCGRTVALLGSSGVGKSTLLNHWVGSPVQKTQEAIRGLDRGRHTTTARQLFYMASGAMVIDTPGLRELQMWTADAGLANAFEDIEALAAACRFRDCSHGNDSGCAVQAAVSSGSIDSGRLENYLKLRREIGFLALKQEHSASWIEKQRWKKVSLLAREARFRSKSRQRLD